MEYQKIINLLGNTTHQPSKFTAKLVEINDEAWGIKIVTISLKLQ